MIGTIIAKVKEIKVKDMLVNLFNQGFNGGDVIIGEMVGFFDKGVTVAAFLNEVDDNIVNLVGKVGVELG